MKMAMKVLKMFFIYATAEYCTTKNPCLRIPFPGEKPKKQELKTFTDDEIVNVLWEPKCSSNIRNVPIPSELMKEITSHRLRQRTELLAQGINEESEFLFTSIDGNF